jgi:hypothetical protein
MLSRFILVGRKARIAFILVAALVGACASIHDSPDYERHRYSQVIEPYERDDVMYFDVILSAQFPDSDAAAEQVRMGWLEGWLEQGSMCPDGYEIVARREFEMLEYNPAHSDIRYEFKCKPRPVA